MHNLSFQFWRRWTCAVCLSVMYLLLITEGHKLFIHSYKITLVHWIYDPEVIAVGLHWLDFFHDLSTLCTTDMGGGSVMLELGSRTLVHFWRIPRCHGYVWWSRRSVGVPYYFRAFAFPYRRCVSSWLCRQRKWTTTFMEQSWANC